VPNPTVGELAQLARASKPKLPATGKGSTRLILIDGPAGAGKTTLANRLAVALGGTPSGGAGSYTPDGALADAAPVQIIHGDDMYEGWGGLPRLDEVLLDRILEPLARGEQGAFEMWDWVADARSHTIRVPQRPWLIIEGVGVAGPRARELAALTVFVEAPWEVRLQRGVERDHYAYDDVVERWNAFEAEERALHARNGTRAAADATVDGTRPVGD